MTGFWREIWVEGPPNRSCALPFEGVKSSMVTHSEGTTGNKCPHLSLFFFPPPFNLLMGSPLAQSIWSLEVRDPLDIDCRGQAQSRIKKESRSGEANKTYPSQSPLGIPALNQLSSISKDVFPLGSEAISLSALTLATHTLRIWTI